MVLAACDRAETPPRYAVTLDVAPLIRQLDAETTLDADEAAEQLAHLGEPVIATLEAALATEPKPIRLGLLEALAQMESPRALAVIARVAHEDGDPEVRGNAVLKLGESAQASVGPALEVALNDPSPLVSHTAAVVCGALCTTPAAIDRMIDIALGALPDVELLRMRGCVARLLESHDAAAVRHAHDRLLERTAIILASSESIDRRARAALFAMQAGASDAEPVLAAAILQSTSTGLQTAALHELAKHGTAASVPTLERLVRAQKVPGGALLALQSIAARGVPEASAALAAVK